MATLDKKSVKKTLVKLNLDIILRLLLSCKKDYQLFFDNDVNSPRKELSIHRQALIDHIVNTDDDAIYGQAKAIADSLALPEAKIKSIKEKIKPIKEDLDAKKKELNSSVIDKKIAEEQKVSELHDGLDYAAKNQLVQYNAVVEKVAVKTKNDKQMKKSLNVVAHGFIASNIAGVTEEFGEAICEVNKVTFGFFDKLRRQIRQQKEAEINFDTVAGLDRVNQKFEKEWSSIHETYVINETGLNPDWKQTEAVTHQSEEVSEPKLLMPAKSETLAIAA